MKSVALTVKLPECGTLVGELGEVWGCFLKLFERECYWQIARDQ